MARISAKAQEYLDAQGTASAAAFVKTFKIGVPRSMEPVPVAFKRGTHDIGSPLTYIERHESVQSMMDFGPCTPKSFEELADSYSPSGRDFDPIDWLGIAGTNMQCIDLIRSGWKDGAAKLRTLADGLQANAPAVVKRRVIRSDQGDEFDIHRAYAGSIDRAWKRAQRRKVGGSRNVVIALEAGGPFNMLASKFFWRGAAALVLTDALTEAGYSVELWTVAAAEGVTTGKHAHQCAVKVKSSDMPVDIESLAATLCLAGFHRAGIFARRATLPHTVDSCFGGTCDPNLEAVGLGHAYAVPRTRITDEATAKSWLNETIEKIESEGRF